MKLNGSKPKKYVFVPVGVLIIFVLLNRSVVKVPITVHPPEKTVTPYGGRLTLIMPGHTHMVVHLKDKNKMRHRKRWSQVCERTCINKYAYFISDICFEWLLMACCESYRLWLKFVHRLSLFLSSYNFTFLSSSEPEPVSFFLS